MFSLPVLIQKKPAARLVSNSILADFYI